MDCVSFSMERKSAIRTEYNPFRIKSRKKAKFALFLTSEVIT